MPELPEIASRAKEMNTLLEGKQIQSIEILQPKCLNLPVEEFQASLLGAVIEKTTYHGKWIQTLTSKGWLLINLGMGGEILLTSRSKLPAKYRAVFDFSDLTCLTINFWWFGYLFYAKLDEISQIPMIAKLGPNILDISENQFSTLVSAQNKKLKVKQLLLDQSKMAGIGNAYIHDILFFARLHPSQLVSNLDEERISSLYQAIRHGLIPSLEKGGAFYEVDLNGEKGGFSFDHIQIGYHEGKPCPNCGSLIQKIKTGSTSSFICPTCQVLFD